MKFKLIVNGVTREIDAPPTRRLLDILREDLGLTGAKEGCGEGGCGACAVLLDGRLVNSCMVPALQLPGRSVETVESLALDGEPDVLQQAFIDSGAVQCGFCTPGMLMAARALLACNPRPSRDDIRTAISGNLCRCTGYESIVDAVEKAAAGGYSPSLLTGTGNHEFSLAPEERGKVFLPRALDEALSILSEHPGGVVLVAGGTDLIVEMEKGGRSAPEMMMDLGGIDELQEIRVSGDWLEIGAGATFTDIATDERALEIAPMLASCAAQMGSPAVQNRATIGGNLATASAAGDSPPVLMALDAIIVLASKAGLREVTAVEFFSKYRKTELRDDELIKSVRIPLAARDHVQMFRKVGPRRAMVISRITLACSAEVRDGKTLSCRLYTGSMSPVPLLLERASELVVGKILTVELAEEAGRLAEEAVSPRTSPEYRKEATGKLVARFFKDILEGKAGGTLG
ncbi:MAG: 2Fe-2S iron-sulfur cluster binding domain-containing protein [Synergistaceae bacterium]|nr:FAD binding domain-containing protein [Synergistota bacterium]NLM71623.1 2Fe-2S iron-sulfur cluster binding domain-containing protein [Synergistaceae bacterium]